MKTYAVVLGIWLGFGVSANGITWTTLDYPGSMNYSPILGVEDGLIWGLHYGQHPFISSFIYDGANFRDFAYSAGSIDTSIGGIDNAMVVGSLSIAEGPWQGFVYNGTTWKILNYPGAGQTRVNGVDNGNIVGYYRDEEGAFRGFLYDGTTWTSLAYPGAWYTNIEGIVGTNIFGFYQTGTGHGSFIYDGTNWNEFKFPEAIGTYLYDIDGKNMVGSFYKAVEEQQGFLHDGTTWTTLNFPGARQTCVTGIEGNTIVGFYSNNIPEMFDFHGFIATIPEPVAEAGPNQIVYAGIDNKAEVTLDALDSNDPDGHALTYKWTWTIDANTYETNSVNPTIELHVGVHTVELVVNNGFMDSLPDEVVITVVGAADAIGELKQDIAAMNLANGVANELTAKLDAAMKKLADGKGKNDEAAVNFLEAFVNAVNAQRGKKISEENAASLISRVQQIIEVWQTAVLD